MREIVRVEVRDPHAMSLVTEETGEMKPMDVLEAEIIRFALQFYRQRMSEVSRRLGIGRSTLYRKLKDLGLEDDAKTEDAADRAPRALTHRPHSVGAVVREIHLMLHAIDRRLGRS